MAVDIRILRNGDEGVLARVDEDVFDYAVDPDLTREFLADPRHHIVVAMEGDLVVGMATGVHYIHPDKPAELWVNEASVAQRYRRRGVAKRLMAALFAHGRTLGCAVAWLGTESTNTAAMALYRSIGGRVTESDVFFEFDIAAPVSPPAGDPARRAAPARSAAPSAQPKRAKAAGRQKR